MQDTSTTAVIETEVLRGAGWALRESMSELGRLARDPRLGGEAMAVIEAGVAGVLRIANELSDAADLNAGSLELRHIAFRPGDAIREAVRLARAAAASRGLDITMSGLNRLPFEVVGDPGRLRQVLAVMLDESVRRLAVGWVTVAADVVSEDEEAVRIRVDVRGSHDSEIDSRQVSVGDPLGLALARRVVALMGGSVDTSDDGNGFTAVFELELPSILADTSNPSAPSTSWVAVVSERMDAGRRVEELLERSGFGVTRFGAVSLAGASLGLSADPQSDPLAVLVVTGSRGLDEVTQVVSDQRLARLPMVVVAAEGERGDAAICERLGMEGYLPEPVSAIDLSEAMAEVSRRRGRGGPLITRHWLRERRRSLRVVVAEDSPTLRGPLIRGLEELGHRVSVVTPGLLADGVSADVDAVLLATDLISADHRAVLAALKMHRKLSGAVVPVVALSGWAGEETSQDFDARVSKPVRMEELQRVLDRL